MSELIPPPCSLLQVRPSPPMASCPLPRVLLRVTNANGAEQLCADKSHQSLSAANLRDFSIHLEASPEPELPSALALVLLCCRQLYHFLILNRAFRGCSEWQESDL